MSLFSRYDLRSLRLPNRIVISPMCQYSAEQGRATDWHLIHWGQLLLSGAGLLVVEATGVVPEGRITAACLGLWDAATEQALGDTLARARRQAPPMPVALQLAHAGRKASSQLPWEGGQLIPPERGGWRPVAPSAVPHAPHEPAPAELTPAAIEGLVRAFAQAAERAHRIGIDALELHMAHGYLMHEFLSPIANRRTDGYGGGFEGRIRFPLEVFDATRAAWPADKPLGVRISATDWVEGGWDLEQSIELARRLASCGCDWVDVSSGGISPAQKIPIGPAYQVPLARAIRQATGVTTIAVGLITEPVQAQAIVDAGEADLVAFARGFLYDPRWPWRAAAALGGQVQGPRQYWRALTRDASGIFGDLRMGGR